MMTDKGASITVRHDRNAMTGWFWRLFAICFTASLLSACGQSGVPGNPNDVHPLLPGMTAPAFEAIDSNGRTYVFDPGKADKPLVVNFYRGGWCPYCSKQLMAYRDVEKRLIEMGYEVLFVSPDLPETSAAHLGDGDFEFTLLSDSDMAITRSFGLAFRLDDETFNRYVDEHGFDLEGDSGQTHHYLPVPATYLIGTDGVIKFMYANPNYKVRLDPELLEAAARTALE
jgi:peroxiredoxin